MTTTPSPGAPPGAQGAEQNVRESEGRPGGRPGGPGGRGRPRPRATHVVRSERISEHLVRIVLGGESLRQGFDPVAAESYVKLFFLTPGVSYPEPLDLEAIRAEFPQEHWPRVRTYTVRSWDPESAEVAIDIVIHGDQGVAGPWAGSAQPGDVVYLGGPGGHWSPDGSAAAHLLVGDESALPAIAVALEQLSPNAVVRAFIEVPEAADELELARPVTWVHRGDRAVGEALLTAVMAEPVPEGTHAFVHGEASFVKELRRWLRNDRQVPLDRLSISGYWRLGQDDEGWRAGKAAWMAEVTAADSGSPTG